MSATAATIATSTAGNSGRSVASSAASSVASSRDNSSSGKSRGAKKRGHSKAATTPAKPETDMTSAKHDTSQDSHCFICTEEPTIVAVGACNHRTCHICALRLRALYKNKQCAYCKTNQDWVIFTRDLAHDYTSFAGGEPACVDASLGIKYQHKDIFDESAHLLKANCPDENCEASIANWSKLKTHVREKHSLSLCELCVKYKKAFAHEHQLFTRNQLRDHMRGVSQDPASGFRGHPECRFCVQSFYDNDMLYEHCRDKHEQCHLCVRAGVGRHDYFRNYHELERHFSQDHFPCMYKECVDSKFVVFSTDIDLKAHEHEVHGVAATGQRSLQRNARRIDIDIVYAGGPSERHRDRERLRGNEQPRPRDGSSRGGGSARSQNATTIPNGSSNSQPAPQQMRLPSDVQSPRSNQNGNNRSVGGQGANGTANSRRSRAPEGFGRLTEETNGASTSAAQPNGDLRSDTGRDSDSLRSTSANESTIKPPKMEAAIKKRVQPILTRFAPKLNNQLKLIQLQMLLIDFFKDVMPVGDFLDSVTALVAGSSGNLAGKIVTAVVEQLGDERQRTLLLRSWRDRVAVEKQYPDLQTSDLYTSSTLGRAAKNGKQPANGQSAWQAQRADPQPALSASWNDNPGASASTSTSRSASRTASDVVRNTRTAYATSAGSSGTSRGKGGGAATGEFPALPSRPRIARPIIGRRAESQWTTGGMPGASTATSSSASSSAQSGQKKGKGKGKTVLCYYN